MEPKSLLPLDAAYAADFPRQLKSVLVGIKIAENMPAGILAA
jgi:hypothetical protein